MKAGLDARRKAAALAPLDGAEEAAFYLWGHLSESMLPEERKEARSMLELSLKLDFPRALELRPL